MKTNEFKIIIDNKSGLAPYRQIINQIKLAIDSDIWKAGEPLPSIRELSEQLGVAPLTVAKSYLQLEQMGLIKTRWGKGSFVNDTLPARNKEKHERIEENLIDQFLNNVQQAGLDPKQILSRMEKKLIVKPRNK